MSLITQCPSCQTVFRVVPDQLRISEGWVRCGHCAEVFDASLALRPFPVSHSDWLEPSEPRPQGMGGDETEAPPVGFDHAPGVDALPQGHSVQTVDLELIFPDEEVLNKPANEKREGAPEAVAIPKADMPGQETAALMSAHSPETESWPNPRADAVIPPAQVSLPTAALSDRPSFMHHGAVATRSSSLLAKVCWAVALVVLLLSLFGQFIYQERDRLAATGPVVGNGLQNLCARLGCVISPLRQIDAITIESSSFTKLGKDAFQLSFAIKNRGLVPLALPALELTLTNTKDEALVRRVLLPAELGAGMKDIPPGQDWSGVAVIGMGLGDIADQMTGYRLLAFYP